MASANANPQRRILAVPLGRISRPAERDQQSGKAPYSYAEALSQGWSVIDEKTPFVHGKGVLTMAKEGVSQLVTIGYAPTATGYEYAAPQFATEGTSPDAEDCWAEHFQRFGCASCSRKDVPHAQSGLCASCRDRIAGQLEQVIQEPR
jgi:hypothetical protein